MSEPAPNIAADLGTDEDDAERLYRWTIRTLYVVAIGLNVWLLWGQLKDTPEVEIARRRLAQRVERFKARTEPMRARFDFRHHADAVIYEATAVVEAAANE